MRGKPYFQPEPCKKVAVLTKAFASFSKIIRKRQQLASQLYFKG